MLSWTEAKSTCQSMTGGRGSLAVIESSAVEAGLLPILIPTGLAIRLNFQKIIHLTLFFVYLKPILKCFVFREGSVWIGLNDIEIEGKFVWENGRPQR